MGYRYPDPLGKRVGCYDDCQPNQRLQCPAAPDRLGNDRVAGRRGNIVKNSGTEELAGPLIRVTLSGNRSMEELLQFRRRVEFVGTEEAAKRATENDVLRLESLIEQMKESVNHQNYDQYEYIDCAFHLALVETSGFNLLVSMMWVLWEILDCYFDGRKMKWDLDKCYIKHYSVYEAVKQHDPIQVAATINENIRDLLLLVEAERGS